MYIVPFKQFILEKRRKKKKVKTNKSFLDKITMTKPDAEPDVKNDTPKPKMLKISLEI